MWQCSGALKYTVFPTVLHNVLRRLPLGVNREMVWCPCVCLGKSDRRRLLMDGGVLFQGCRLEVGGLLGGPKGGGDGSWEV